MLDKSNSNNATKRFREAIDYTQLYARAKD